MTREKLFGNILKKNSFLCVGLDSDLEKIPECLLGESDPIFSFNKEIIDATADFCISYKPNLAFYEAAGKKGWESYEKTVEYLRKNYPDHFIIADAKRGDIGNTSRLYARCFFEDVPVDAVTVSPYMGEDSVMPFLSYPNACVILLALTSNNGSKDFQLIEDQNGVRLFEHVLKTSSQWAGPDQMMYVIGATQAEMLKEVRKIVPDYFLLIPGVGSQGGSLQKVCEYGMNSHCGLIVNASRSIIYADSSSKFASRAKEEAQKLQQEMKTYLEIFLR